MDLMHEYELIKLALFKGHNTSLINSEGTRPVQSTQIQRCILKRYEAIPHRGQQLGEHLEAGGFWKAFK